MNTIIYLPGLGGRLLIGAQQLLLAIHSKQNQRIVTFQPKWHEEESYDLKWSRLDTLVRSMQNSKVFIVAASAGGPLAVRLISSHPEIISATIICGKLTDAAGIDTSYRGVAPALYDAVRMSEQLIATEAPAFSSKLTILRPKKDEVVPKKDMFVPGALVKTIPAYTHTSAIIWGLLFHFPSTHPKIILTRKK